MDPYLESHWRDVHASLVIYIRDALQDALPPELRARVEERVILETPEGLGNALFPDVRVFEHGPHNRGGTVSVTRLAGSEGVLIDIEEEPLTEGYIEIIDTSSGNKVVTIIEVLSPANKMPGDDREKYVRKQREIVRSETNLVEIDLLRCGRHVVAVPAAKIFPHQRTPYSVCVRRVTLRTKARVYFIPLWATLPTVMVPLRPTDADVPLDLQALIEQCYRRGRYEGNINYRLDPDPPLSGPEAEWTLELLRGKGLRPAEPPKRKGKRKPRRGSDGA
jgi:hypothetical protein